MSNLIKKFNVTINGGNTATYEVGADAKNVQFSDEATSPFKQEFVENNNQNIDVPKEIVSKAENRIYGNAYIKNNDMNIEGRAQYEGFGPVDDIQIDRTNEGAGALTISYGFNSLAKGHHSTAIGFDCEAAGWASHAEGWKATTAQGTNYSHAEGAKTEANHNAAHAEGDAAKAYGYGSHAEGRGTYVYGVGSHVEGMASNIGFADKVAWQNSNALHGYRYDDPSGNDATNNDVDVELKNPKQVINGQLSHAEGLDNTIYGACCHAEGMYNTIHSVYASTAMGEANQIYSSASVAMGYKNTLNVGSNNSLILGNNNVNPGYPNALFLGQYCGVGTGEGQAPALVIGSGDENTPSNLMTIRHPQTGIASPTNRGFLNAENIEANFGAINIVDDWQEYEVHFSTPGSVTGSPPSNAASTWRMTGSGGTVYEIGTYDFTMVFRYSKTSKIIEVWVYPYLNRNEGHDGTAPYGSWATGTMPPNTISKLSLYRWNGRSNECFINRNDLRDLIQTVVCPAQTSFYMHRGAGDATHAQDYSYSQPSISALFMNIKNLCPPEGESQVISGKELMVFSYPWKNAIPAGTYGGVYHFVYTCV